ncbi:DUF1801 domain-containing protein [Hyphobacterium sp.]|jgi:hypothetical protein|uniref:DUF1801 domain-containing protein n=1 Tax=Hyphobacterium sp. TaxID=2004662 RepID=UPI003BAA9BEC
MTKTPNTYFAQIEESLAPIALALRETVLRAAPELTEKLAWGFPCYVGKERIFSIIAQSGWVNLQLWYGAALADRFGRIEGTGKSLRHVKIRSLGEVDDGLAEIIKAAIVLDASDPRRVA